MSVQLKDNESKALELALERAGREKLVDSIEGNIRSNVPSNVQDGDELIIPEGSKWVNDTVNGNPAPYKVAVGVDKDGNTVTRNIYAGWLQRVYREVDKACVPTAKVFHHTGSLITEYMSHTTKQEGMEAVSGKRFKCALTASPLVKVFGTTTGETKVDKVFDLSFSDAKA